MSIPIRPVIQDKTRIELGKRGENEARIIRWTNLLPKWRETYGAGTVVLLHQRLGDTQPYPAAIQVEGDNIDWTVTAVDTARAGQGSCELQYIVEDSVVKSKRWQTLVFCSLEEPGPAPEPVEGWVRQLVECTDAAVAAGLAELQEAGSAGLEDLQESRTAGLEALQQAQTAGLEALRETTAEGCTALQEAGETARAAVEQARSQAEQQLAGMAQSYSKGESDGRYVPVESALTVSASGDDLVTLSPTVPWALQGLKLFGRTVQDGVPSPESPVPLASAGASGSLALQVTDGGSNSQSLTVQTPNGLPGIPASSGGNYTDESGQQWICDYIDVLTGEYVQNVGMAQITSDSDITYGISASKQGYFKISIPGIFTISESTTVKYGLLCSAFQEYSGDSIYADIGPDGVSYSNNEQNIRVRLNSTPTLDEFKDWVAANPFTICFRLATPEKSTISSISSQSYSGTTNVLCNGVGIQATALADANQYMDNLSQRIAALESAQTDL